MISKKICKHGSLSLSALHCIEKALLLPLEQNDETYCFIFVVTAIHIRVAAQVSIQKTGLISVCHCLSQHLFACIPLKLAIRCHSSHSNHEDKNQKAVLFQKY